MLGKVRLVNLWSEKGSLAAGRSKSVSPFALNSGKNKLYCRIDLTDSVFGSAVSALT